MIEIDADKVSFSYSHEQGELSVLNDFSLSAEKGSFVSILGPSGCGKSTLLRLLSGFYKPHKGRISFNGESIGQPFVQGQMIFQDSDQLLPWLTVEKNILFPRYRSFLSSFRKKSLTEEDNRLFNELLQVTGLEDFRHFYPNELSGGLKQRVSLARALFARPDILFMDEPFVSLDAPSRHELQQLLLKLWKSGGWTIFFVTHDISEALLLSDRMVVFSGDKKEYQLLDNPMERPRMKDDEAFIKEKLHLYSMIDSP